MDEFEQSDLEKETNDSFYQNVVHYKDREITFMKKITSVVYFLCLCYKPMGSYD